MAFTNMKAIQTTTLTGGSAAYIEFTGIPQTYTDLYIKASLRGTGNATLYIRPNNDAGSNYYTAGAYADNTGQDAFVSTYNYAHGGEMQYATLTANTFSTHEIYISNYAASQRHPIMTQDVQAASTANVYLFMTQTLYNVASAITSVRLVPNTGSFAQYSSVTLYGVTNASNTTSGAFATGGTITTDGQYWIHTFTSSGTFTPTKTLNCEYLVIAGGGGGGGADGAGGGGAGGYRCSVAGEYTGGLGAAENAISVSAQAYSITVGAGGAGGTYSSASNGNDSIFSTITASGGGGGVTQATGKTGGSGGGTSSRFNVTRTGGSTSSPTQGFAGGNASTPTGGSGAYAGSGGGGAGAAGNDAFDNSTNGGNGLSSSITGSAVTRGGGGGGQGPNDAGSSGGSGGGGASATFNNDNATAGTANTGGGGGGARAHAGKSGGSGIVIIRYSVNS